LGLLTKRKEVFPKNVNNAKKKAKAREMLKKKTLEIVYVLGRKGNWSGLTGGGSKQVLLEERKTHAREYLLHRHGREDMERKRGSSKKGKHKRMEPRGTALKNSEDQKETVGHPQRGGETQGVSIKDSRVVGKKKNKQKKTK